MRAVSMPNARFFVTVLNPTRKLDGSAGSHRMHIDTALRQVRIGTAVWVDRDRGILRISRQISQDDLSLDRVVCHGTATLKQLRGLPMAGDLSRFLSNARRSNRTA